MGCYGEAAAPCSQPGEHRGLGLMGVVGNMLRVRVASCPSTAWSLCAVLQLIHALHTPKKEPYRKTYRAVIPSPLVL